MVLSATRFCLDFPDTQTALLTYWLPLDLVLAQDPLKEQLVQFSYPEADAGCAGPVHGGRGALQQNPAAGHGLNRVHPEPENRVLELGSSSPLSLLSLVLAENRFKEQIVHLGLLLPGNPGQVLEGQRSSMAAPATSATECLPRDLVHDNGPARPGGERLRPSFHSLGHSASSPSWPTLV